MSEPATICVLDDDPSVCKALGRLLEARGYQAIIYNSATDLLNDGAMEKSDLMIFDVRLPLMGGIELRDHLITNGYHLPIIFITAHASTDLAAMDMKADIVAFLEKPFLENELLEAIETGLKKADRNGETRRAKAPENPLPIKEWQDLPPPAT